MAGRLTGIILVALGVLFLGIQSGIVSAGAEQLWPLFVLVPGLLFELSYFTGKRTGASQGMLVPGGILTVIGLLFCFEVATGWRFSEYTWPIYPLAVAFGLFQLYVVSFPRIKPLLIPVLILVAVTAVSFTAMLTGKILGWLFSGPVLGIALVVLGVYLMTASRRK